MENNDSIELNQFISAASVAKREHDAVIAAIVQAVHDIMETAITEVKIAV